jgi:myosin heavy subunit
MSIERLDNPNSDYYKYLKYKKGDAFGLSQMKSDKQWLYVPAPPPEMFVLAEKIREEGEFVVVKTVNGEEQKVKKNLTHGVNPPKFDGVEDCAALSHLNEPAVFRNLKVRYDDDLIYTYSGLFLVAMNPYKRIPIYTPQMVEIYKGKRRNEIAPHIFAVADTAYRAMLADRQDQSILITYAKPH